MRNYVLISLVLLAAKCFASDFDARERDEIVDLKISIRTTCWQALAADKSAANTPSLSLTRWLKQITEPDAYCACLSDTFATQVTPELLRTGSQDEAENLVRRSGYECLLPKFKSSFAMFCQDYLQEIFGGQVRLDNASQVIAGFCSCVQEDIDGLNVYTFPGFLESSKKEAIELQATGKLSSMKNMGTLFSSMRKCGISDLKNDLIALPPTSQIRRVGN